MAFIGGMNGRKAMALPRDRSRHWDHPRINRLRVLKPEIRVRTAPDKEILEPIIDYYEWPGDRSDGGKIKMHRADFR